MGLNRLSKCRRFYHLVTVVLVLSLLSACATTSQNVTPQVAAPPVPTRVMGHVVDIKKNLPVRVDTSLKAKEIGQLTLGDGVYVNEEKIVGKEEWYQISSMSEGKGGQPLEGWVLSQYIEKDAVVPPPQTAATTGQPQEGSKDLSGMKARTVFEGLGAGALVGAGLGALTAYISGGNVAKGAIIGAAAGGATGLVAGVYVANQKEKFATEEAYLDACAKEAAQYNEEARKANEYLRGYVSDMQLRVKELKAQIKKDKAKKQAARDELATMNQKKQGIDEMVTRLQDEAKAQDGALAGAKKSSPESARLQQEVKTTQQEIEKLKKQREELATLTIKMNDLSV
jgi:hypothetical protein